MQFERQSLHCACASSAAPALAVRRSPYHCTCAASLRRQRPGLRVARATPLDRNEHWIPQSYPNPVVVELRQCRRSYRMQQGWPLGHGGASALPAKHSQPLPRDTRLVPFCGAAQPPEWSEILRMMWLRLLLRARAGTRWRLWTRRRRRWLKGHRS